VQDIAKLCGKTRGTARQTSGLLVALCAMTALTGCMGNGLELEASARIDPNLTTSSVPSQTVENVQSDDLTVGNAVSSADLSKLGSSSIPWANSSTGSAGVISTITETNSNGMLCRQFTTSRHAYSGIANYSGMTCLLSNGQWKVARFEQQS